MTRGKHADRARSKRDADQRLASEITTSNQLRAEVARLRIVDEDNARLRARIAQLQHDVKTGASDELRRTTKVLLETTASRDQLHLDNIARQEDYVARVDRCLTQLRGMRWTPEHERLVGTLIAELDTWAAVTKAKRIGLPAAQIVMSQMKASRLGAVNNPNTDESGTRRAKRKAKVERHFAKVSELGEEITP